MKMQLESPELSPITGYSTHSIRVLDITYDKSIYISPQNTVINCSCISDEDMAILFNKAIEDEAEIILIGSETLLNIPIALRKRLHERQIGFEIMTIGAAARTLNILKSEYRKVSALFIF
jgi:uncharacterized protein